MGDNIFKKHIERDMYVENHIISGMTKTLLHIQIYERDYYLY